jgi:hypothetical protein
MHDGRNVVLSMALGVVALWGLVAWLVVPELWPQARSWLLPHRVAPVAVSPVLVVWLWCEMVFAGEARAGSGRG